VASSILERTEFNGARFEKYVKVLMGIPYDIQNSLQRHHYVHNMQLYYLVARYCLLSSPDGRSDLE